MFFSRLCCFSKTTLQTSIKEAKSCIKCAGNKNIITLVCNHTYCVKCYTQSKFWCKVCERNKTGVFSISKKC